MVFLGASYFRLLGSGQQYGLSARGLAIDTASDSGEEFPRFSAFWIERPGPQAQIIRLYALLESQRITGAYSFMITPATPPRSRCGAAVPALGHRQAGHRAADQHVPLWRGTASGAPTTSARRSTTAMGWRCTRRGEWLWRPLSNTAELSVSAFVDAGPLGFGLFQRDARPCQLSGSGGQLSPAAELLGRARAAIGAAGMSSSSKSRATRKSTTTSSPSGCRKRR